MKYIYLVAALAMTGCVSTRTCEVHTRTAVKHAVGRVLLEDQIDSKIAADEMLEMARHHEEALRESMTRAYCMFIIQEEDRLTRAAKVRSIRLPATCGPIFEELAGHHKS
jgi:hypothetical protein